VLEVTSLPVNVAVSICNLTKTYRTVRFNSKVVVIAVSNLDLNVLAIGIFVMLGSNG
jgi:ABC-type multidrug transport system ATPase subunit